VTKAPDAFRTISEVAVEIDLPQHVLRFWESRFPQIKPMKRGGGRRYYRPDDVELLRGIRHLLYGQGYTIRGVQRILREQGPRFVQSVWQEGAPQPQVPPEPDLGEGETAEDAGETAAAPVEPARERRVPSFASPPPVSGAVVPAAVAAAATETPSVPQAAAVAAEQDRMRAAEPVRAMEKIPAVDREHLRTALEQLDECKRLLDDAFADVEAG
jgi:DNA-binding transcriptional MerR regulator